MKKQQTINYLKVVSICIFSIILTACDREQETSYSCDPAINLFVKENIKTYQSMTRLEWKSLSQDLKIPVYRTFSEKQKIQFWQNKQQELMVFFKDDNYSREHVLKLYNYINSHPNFFKKGYLKNKKLQDFKSFTGKWIKEALDLGWSIQLVFAVSATGEQVNDKLLQNLSKAKLPTPQPMGECACSQKSDFCDIFGELHGVVACRSWNCNNLKEEEDDLEEGGCGLFWKFKCDGICRGIGW